MRDLGRRKLQPILPNKTCPMPLMLARMLQKRDDFCYFGELLVFVMYGELGRRPQFLSLRSPSNIVVCEQDSIFEQQLHQHFSRENTWV